MVMAYNARGDLEPTPESETVRVPVCPEPRDERGRVIADGDGATRFVHLGRLRFDRLSTRLSMLIATCSAPKRRCCRAS